MVVNPAAITPNIKNVERWDGVTPHTLLGTSTNNVFDFSTFTGMADLTYVDGLGGSDVIKGSLTYTYNDDFRGGLGDDGFTATPATTRWKAARARTSLMAATATTS